MQQLQLGLTQCYYSEGRWFHDNVFRAFSVSFLMLLA